MTDYNYPKIYKEGNIEIENIMDGSISVQEKIDGSQYKIVLCNGKIDISSKNVNNIQCKEIIDVIKKGLEVKMHETVIYGEYLSKPKHNNIKYDRVPKGNFIVFDIKRKDGVFLNHEDICFYLYSMNYDFEVVPTYYQGKAEDFTDDMLKHYMKSKPTLGGKFIEGVVVKNYGKNYDEERFASLKGMFMMKKIVNEDYKEVKSRPDGKGGNNASEVFEKYKTKARWDKVIRTAIERDNIIGTMKDMGELINILKEDVKLEDKETIKEKLWDVYCKKGLSSLTVGFADYYKEFLAKTEECEKCNSGLLACEICEQHVEFLEEGICEVCNSEDDC